MYEMSRSNFCISFFKKHIFRHLLCVNAINTENKCKIYPLPELPIFVLFLQVPLFIEHLEIVFLFRDAAGFSNPGGLAVMWWA